MLYAGALLTGLGMLEYLGNKLEKYNPNRDNYSDWSGENSTQDKKLRCRDCFGSVVVNHVDNREVLENPSNNSNGIERLTREIEDAYCLDCNNEGSVDEVLEVRRHTMMYSHPTISPRGIWLWGDVTNSMQTIPSNRIGDSEFWDQKDRPILVSTIDSLYRKFGGDEPRNVRELLSLSMPSYEWDFYGNEKRVNSDFAKLMKELTA